MQRHTIVKWAKNRPLGLQPNQAAALLALRGRYLTARELRDEVFPDYAVQTVRDALTQLRKKRFIDVYYTMPVGPTRVPTNVYHVPKRKKS